MTSNAKDLLEELYWNHYEVTCHERPTNEWVVSMSIARCYIKRTGLDLYNTIIEAKSDLDQYLNKEHTA